MPIENVFISYSWDSDEHKLNVLSLANALRHKGVNTQIDEEIKQEETAIDFFRMMHSYLRVSQKVIIILSKGYKTKADEFIGGAGKEYELIIKDIDKNPRKYILVSFEGISDDIVPFGFLKREIVDLSPPKRLTSFEILLRKIYHKPEYKLAPVADIAIELPEKEIPSFFHSEITTELSGKKDIPSSANKKRTVNKIAKFLNKQSIYPLIILALVLFVPSLLYEYLNKKESKTQTKDLSSKVKISPVIDSSKKPVDIKALPQLPESSKQAQADSLTKKPLLLNESKDNLQAVKKEIKIGSQIWMTQNLDVETYRDGTKIIEAESSEDWKNCFEQKLGCWCYYAGKKKYENVYGKYYNQYAVHDKAHGGIAPRGWHIASSVEYDDLIQYLGGEEIGGRRMMDDKTWRIKSVRKNSCGWNGVASGERSVDGIFYNTDVFGYWWPQTDTKNIVGYDDVRHITFSGEFGWVGLPSGGGYPVRCIKD